MEINESGNSILAVELLPATRTNFREELSLNTLPPFAFPISCSPSGKYIPSSLVQLPKAYFPNVFNELGSVITPANSLLPLNACDPILLSEVAEEKSTSAIL